jgi:hypothetical protein
VLSPARAERLARRAAARRGDGRRTRPSRRAWRVLTAGGDRGDDNAIQALWTAWLAAPDDELWDVLARWRGPEALAVAAFEAATRPGRDVAERAAIGEFCARRWDVGLYSNADLVSIPERGEIAVLPGGQPIAYLDAQTLATIGESRELTGRSGTKLWSSAGGSYHALGHQSPGRREVVVEVVDRRMSVVHWLAAKPMAELRPNDLAAAKSARDAFPGGAARPFLDLFVACLEHRFGADVRTGAAAPMAAHDNDISLAAAGDRPW